MRKASTILALALGLTACGQGGLEPGFNVVGGVNGAKIDVEVIYARDASGNLIVKENNFVLQQPSVSFVAQAGSLGGTVHSATVTMKDSSGNLYGDQAGKYSQSFTANIIPGWACVTDDVPDLESPPVGCTNPVVVQRVTTPDPKNSQLISPQVAQQAAADCASAFGCVTNLKADILFGVRDNRGTERTVAVNNVPVSVYANYKSEETP